MGTLTLAELKDELKRGLGNRSDTDSRLTRFLNMAQQRVSRLHDFEEMQTSTVGTFSITAAPATDKILVLPNLRELYSFRVVNGAESQKLVQVSPRLWDKTIPEPEYFSRNQPTHYTIWAKQVEMWPVPDIAYNYAIRWTRWPSAFSDSALTATSEFDAKDELLIVLGLGYAFAQLSKTSDADRCYQQAKVLLIESLAMESTRPDLESAPASELFSSNAPTGRYWEDPFVSSV